MFPFCSASLTRIRTPLRRYSRVEIQSVYFQGLDVVVVVVVVVGGGGGGGGGNDDDDDYDEGFMSN